MLCKLHILGLLDIWTKLHKVRLLAYPFQFSMMVFKTNYSMFGLSFHVLSHSFSHYIDLPLFVIVKQCGLFIIRHTPNLNFISGNMQRMQTRLQSSINTQPPPTSPEMIQQRNIVPHGFVCFNCCSVIIVMTSISTSISVHCSDGCSMAFTSF